MNSTQDPNMTIDNNLGEYSAPALYEDKMGVILRQRATPEQFSRR